MMGCGVFLLKKMNQDKGKLQMDQHVCQPFAISVLGFFRVIID